MAFDDLAKHMAARDRKKLGTGKNADELVAEAAVADRLHSRQRDLILGGLLTCFGAAGFAVIFLYGMPSTIHRRDVRVAAGCVAMLALGIHRIYRALRDRSHLAPDDGGPSPRLRPRV